MNQPTQKAIRAIIATDESILPDQRDAALSILNGRMPQNGPVSLLLTQKQAASLLGISRFTVWRMTQEGKLHPVKVHETLRYRRAEIEKIADGPPA
ncbi:MAG: helix-turn-helix domain-containing protein [Lentisphaerae bacterium]|nr:helix-turn-helix domain-containing protein [Lentisphaerota bacterium]